MEKNYNKTEGVDKKFLLVIFIIVILLIAAIISIAILNKKNNNNNNEETTTTVEATTTTTEATTKKSKKEKTTKKANTKTTKKANSTATKKTTKVIVDGKELTYVCPEGYDIDDDTCISIKDPAMVCEDGWTSYDDNTCVDYNNHQYPVQENEVCQIGYVYKKADILFGDDEFYCHPTKEKVYGCDKGYNLVDNKCIRKVLATKE